MKFKVNVEVVYTDDIYESLFLDGSIEPKDFLEEEDSLKVKAAMLVIDTFLDSAINKKYIEFY